MLSVTRYQSGPYGTSMALGLTWKNAAWNSHPSPSQVNAALDRVELSDALNAMSAPLVYG